MEAPVDTPVSREVSYWSVENDNPIRVASRLCDYEEGDAQEMTSGMLSDFPTTFEVFSTLLSWAFLAFSSTFLLFSFSLSSFSYFFRVALSASFFLARTFSLSSSSRKERSSNSS
jgi:hypothetical protein